jgi:hypothetical protein
MFTFFLCTDDSFVENHLSGTIIKMKKIYIYIVLYYLKVVYIYMI